MINHHITAVQLHGSGQRWRTCEAFITKMKTTVNVLMKWKPIK